jgi:hypothetical protein
MFTHNRFMIFYRTQLGLALMCAALSACAPTLNWREFVPEGGELSVTFPCKPDRHRRSVKLVNAVVTMELLSCTAGGNTYAVSWAQLAEPTQMAAALTELQAKTVQNIQGQALRSVPAQIKGMTPNPAAVQMMASGQLLSGAPVQSEATFFARGLRVYQATVMGPQLEPEAVSVFLSGLKFATQG